MDHTMSLDGVLGTVLCLLLAWLSFAFTLSVAAGTRRSPSAISLAPRTAPTRLALAAQKRALHRAHLAHLHLHPTPRTYSPASFPLAALPPELQLLIFAHLAPHPHAYRALTRVSHAIYALTLRACLPRTPITLSTPVQLASFTLLLASPLHPTLYAPALVHHLLVCPLRRIKEDKDLAAAILARCTNVRALACDARTLRAGLGLGAKTARLRHTRCTRLTLLLARPGWDATLAGPARAFLQRLMHLRVPTAQCVPVSCSMPRLAHLSYRALGRRGKKEEGEEEERQWAREGLFPALREVVVTSSRSRAGAETGEEGKGKGHTGETERDVVVRRVHVPREYTEIHLWRAGVWEQT